MKTSRSAQLVEHVHEHFAKYAVVVLPLLAIAAAALGQAASTLGGDNTLTGHRIGQVAGALVTAGAGIRYMRDRFNWKFAASFGPEMVAAMGIGKVPYGTVTPGVSAANPLGLTDDEMGDMAALPEMPVANVGSIPPDVGDVGPQA